ncbi:hypothetical protein TIFTF001_036843 [Ficus carica]|uniref:RNase H type-1 domain-containing protein n=1 Tax=Ficus carica TaxID=3494 RepID=A0AA88E624_FICCA|nr:hypothetical protein TIFTF001_036843 [Ficus carica]
MNTTTMRNFLWSGKIDKKIVATVAWDKSCRPKREGGFRIRLLEATNHAFLKKMAWRIIGEMCMMSEFIRNRYLINFRKIRSGYVTSSIWPALRDCYSELLGECIWIVGNNSGMKSSSRVLLEISKYCHGYSYYNIADRTTDDLRWKLCSNGKHRLRDFYEVATNKSQEAEEDLDHIFIHCDFVKTIWTKLEEVFQGKVPSLRRAIMVIWSCIQEFDVHDSGTMNNSITDLIILKQFKIAYKIKRAPAIIEVQWKVPTMSWIKINTNGAANGSPGMAGCRGIFRTYRGFCKGCFSKPLGIMHAFKAELLGVITALEYTQQFNWCRLWFESDSSYVVQLLRSQSKSVPWK